jgi:uncharacterized protein YndB with AHSA1/START domain
MSGAPVEPIDLVIEVPVTAAAAWAAITDPERIAGWFTDATVLGPVGSPYRLDFGDGSVVGGTVLAVDPGRSFSHSWAWAGAEPVETTTVTWSVEPSALGARIRLVHDGWDAAGLDGETRDDHAGYWRGYLEDLGAVLDTA